MEPFDIHYKRGRDYIHSLGPNNDANVADVSDCLAHAYEEADSPQPLDQRSYRSNTRRVSQQWSRL